MNSHGFNIFPLPLPITNNVRYTTSEVEIYTTWVNIRYLKDKIRCLKDDLCW